MQLPRVSKSMIRLRSNTVVPYYFRTPYWGNGIYILLAMERRSHQHDGINRTSNMDALKKNKLNMERDKKNWIYSTISFREFGRSYKIYGDKQKTVVNFHFKN